MVKSQETCGPRHVAPWIYVLMVFLAVCVIGAMAVILSRAPTYATPLQIQRYIDMQPASCRSVARARLHRKMAAETSPLNLSWLNADGPMRGIDRSDCDTLTRQMESIEAGRTAIEP